MFKRKMYSELLKWKSSFKKKVFVLKGTCQTGKTTLIKNFTQENYEIYHVNGGIRLTSNNISIKNNIINLSYYLTFLLTEV